MIGSSNLNGSDFESRTIPAPVEGTVAKGGIDQHGQTSQQESAAFSYYHPHPTAPDIEGDTRQDLNNEEQVRQDYAYAFQLAQESQVPVAEVVPARKRSPSVLEEDKYYPYFIYCILIINIVVFVTELVVNHVREGRVLEPFQVNPTAGPSIETLIIMGAKLTDLIVLNSEGWRLVTSMFLHAGILHLVFNLLFLWIFGTQLERAFGCGKIAYIFLASGLTGTVISAIFLPDLPTVGASGACFGLIGATWADLFLNCSYFRGYIIRNVLQLGFCTIMNLGLGLLPYIDNFAHLGGFVTGLMVGLGVLSRKRYYTSGEEKPEKIYQIAVSMLFSFITPLMIIFLVVLLYSGVDAAEMCPWCTYLSCVPSPWWTCTPSCSSDYRIETLTEGVNAGNIELTCPADLGMKIIKPPFPPLETVEEQIALCEAHCFE